LAQSCPEPVEGMAEIEIGIMRHQCLRRRIADEWTLRAELMSWEMRSNEACRKIHCSNSQFEIRAVISGGTSSSSRDLIINSHSVSQLGKAL
jgi:hypothetical protein